MHATNCKVTVRAQDIVAPDIRRLVVAWGEGEPQAFPHAGQFYMLRAWRADEAPLLLLCKELSAAGPKPELYVGFRDEPYGLEAFLPYCGAISVATDSGAAGYHGLVTGILHPENFDLVLACGPTPMMRGVAALCKEKGVRCLVSLERKMACGLGACLGCTCQTKVGPRTVCKDGPVFSAEEVFDLD